MSCNIFDVVLHPSLFCQPGGSPHFRSDTSSSPSYAPLPSNQLTTTGPLPPPLPPSTQWAGDEWSEIRQRLWNAKRMPGS
ncbi:hypothetical protein FBU31_004279 [Coemansia sp. 'formosensis']|nr:hypothetical protein FBU31_004279 [Coemansia sp. 'formosensis']